MPRSIHRRELRLQRADLLALAEEVLREGQRFCFRARGRSMVPWILDGDTLEIIPINPEDVRCGDVVLCKAGREHLFAHRVLQVKRIENQGQAQILFLLRGDSLRTTNGFVSASQVLGKVTQVHRNEKHWNTNALGYRFAVRLWMLPKARSIYWRLVRHGRIASWLWR